MNSQQKSKPKLLIATTTFPRWENDTDPPFVYELARRLTDDFEVHVLTPGYPGAKSHETIEQVQVKRFRYFIKPFEKLAGSVGILPTLRQNRWYWFVVPFYLSANFVSLVNQCRKIKPDILHAHWIIPLGYLAYLVTRFMRIPYIVTAHGADVFGLQGAIFRSMRKVVVHNAVYVTAVSSALKKKLNGDVDFDQDIRILPMGVDINRFNLDWARQKRITNLLYVGRLTEKKGVTYLIQALPAVLQDFPDAHLTVVGAGELAEQLEAEVIMLGLKQSVTFTGAIPNNKLPVYYAANNIFIGPSIIATDGDTEGFGLTFVEAAMSGCLLIGTEVGGIKDIITDNVSGLLVRQRNSDDLANKIIYALQHPNRMATIAKEGTKRSKQYDWSIIRNGYADLYKNAISM